MMALRSPIALAALCSALTLVARPSAAQTKSPAATEKESDPVTDQARELYVKGAQLYAKGEWAKAHAAFLASFRLKPHWSTASNLGASEMKLGKYRDAAEHLAFSLREQPADGDPAGRKRTAELLDQARAQVGRVTIRVNVEGAEISIDHHPIGRAPFADEVFVEPGQRVIEATRVGYQDSQQVIQAPAGSAQTVSLTLVPIEKPPVEPPPIVPETVPSPVPWLIGGAAVAAIGLSIGIGLTAVANGKSTDADELLANNGGRSSCFGREGSPECIAIRDALESQDAFTDGAKASFVIGGAAVLGTIATYVLWPKPRRAPSSGATAMPWARAGGAGVTVIGTF